jgi:hypothetical protein
LITFRPRRPFIESRRLALMEVLPEAIQQQVREGNPNAEWCEFEERPDRAPAATSEVQSFCSRHNSYRYSLISLSSFPDPPKR